MKRLEVSMIVLLSLLIVAIVYVYGLGQLKQRSDSSSYAKRNDGIAECIKSSTGEDETQWAWAAFRDIDTARISKMTGANENIIRECLDRWN